MSFRITLWFEDYNGNEAQTGLTVSSATTFAQLVDITNAFEAAVSQVSTARITRAEISSRIFTNAPIQAGINSNVDRRLLVLFTDGARYASLWIPSGVVSDVEAIGTGSGYRIAAGQNPTQEAIDALRIALEGAVSPDGLQWPNARAMATITKNPVS